MQAEIIETDELFIPVHKNFATLQSNYDLQNRSLTVDFLNKGMPVFRYNDEGLMCPVPAWLTIESIVRGILAKPS